jgi:hypothetical protein
LNSNLIDVIGVFVMALVAPLISLALNLSGLSSGLLWIALGVIFVLVHRLILRRRI